MAASFIGERLRETRLARGLTQEQVAERARLARTTVNRIERNKEAAGPKRLARLAAALDVSVLELAPEAEADPLGLTLLGRQEALEAECLRLTKLVQALARRVGALERQSPGGDALGKAAS